ncbi:MAG TPA: dihydroorotate dehydrogenase-like protein [Gaiellaceae bacterium]|nr:dihydroorotate dehydrogenase-like protein [Gaiellaceae bacterium]
MTPSLSTGYLGFELASPIVPAASPLGADLDMLKRLEEAGAGAVVLPSLFEEQIEHETMEIHRSLDIGRNGSAEATSYFPELDAYNTGPDAYLEHVAAAKRALSVPVVASLNGSSRGGWVQHARLIEQAGADALELNVYAVEADPLTTAEEAETRILDVVRAVRAELRIPLAVKIGPFFTALAHTAARMVVAGADGLVLFNRFLQPDIDLEALAVVDRLELSRREELRLPLRWIALLHGRVPISLAATSGVHEAEDVLKALLAGADVAMPASALIRQGPAKLAEMVTGVERWLEDHEYESVEQLKGSMSQQSCPDPAAFERAHYMRAITGFGVSSR